jgi:hypothetical protein
MASPVTSRPQLKGDGSKQPFYEEIGPFRYLADHTRPDMLAFVNIVGSGTANPHDEHVEGVGIRIFTSHKVNSPINCFCLIKFHTLFTGFGA